MYWLDLAIISFILWGGITGYLCGPFKSLVRLIVALIAVMMAHLSKNNFVIMVRTFLPLEEEVKRVINANLVIPVQGPVQGSNYSSGITLKKIIEEIKMPEVIQESMVKKIEETYPSVLEQTASGIYLSELLTEVTFSVIGFMLALLMWNAWLNLGKELVIRKYNFPHYLNYAAFLGFLIGIFCNIILMGLFSGILGITSWLYPSLYQAFDINSSMLFQWCLKIYHLIGV